MSPPHQPLLPPPPPRFAVKFSTDEASADETARHGEWPEPERQEGNARDPGGAPWQLKTDSEEHLDKLEARLHQLRAAAPARLADPASPSAAALAYPADLSDVEEFIGESEDGEAGEPEGAAAGDSAEEGRALLSAVGSLGAQAAEGDRMPDPQGDDEDAVHAVADEEAALDASVPPLHRITFGDTVRISGGMRSSSRPHRHRHAEGRAATERTALLASLPRNAAAPSNLLVAAVTPSNVSSRSTSPAASGSRRPSIQSHPSSYISQSSFAHLHAASYPYSYSTSPASYGASRSSSPCSSIYAPLQPPSKHCPNPLWVRTTAQRGLRRSRSAASMSFQDFLRAGRAAAGEDALAPFSDDDDSDDDVGDGQGELDRRLEYHDLVEQQRLKRARWEARRAQARKEALASLRRSRSREDADAALRNAEASAGGFWDKLAGLLALGTVAVGPARPSSLGAPGGVGGTSGSSPSRQGRAPTRGGGVGGRRAPGAGASPARSSPLARPDPALSLPSHLATLSDGDGDEGDESDDAAGAPLERRARSSAGSSASSSLHSSLRPAARVVVKTEADVRFGPAPRRYLRLDWLRFKLAQLVARAKRALATALVGLQQSRRGPVLESGYEEV
ncbi:hypothetical protein Rhopal_005494-T1 [Rhodotorula paludigena]|uniref:Uncharacterized protein n=1 Tax=Rhodotorula paludigena TaxID=86838 RepID=A0AAV5GTA1_9BASI|nr:hypothetical protein Rhopal_005494-T1 [Rhodotorula paludigena]